MNARPARDPECFACTTLTDPASIRTPTANIRSGIPLPVSEPSLDGATSLTTILLYLPLCTLLILSHLVSSQHDAKWVAGSSHVKRTAYAQGSTLRSVGQTYPQAASPRWISKALHTGAWGVLHAYSMRSTTPFPPRLEIQLRSSGQRTHVATGNDLRGGSLCLRRRSRSTDQDLTP